MNHPWQDFMHSVALDDHHFSAIFSSWCSMDRLSTRFLVWPIYYLSQSQSYWYRPVNYLIRVLTCFYLLKTTLHPVFFNSFVICDQMASIHVIVTIFLTLLSSLVSFIIMINQNSITVTSNSKGNHNFKLSVKAL